MRRPVGATKTGTVQAEHDRQILQRDLLEDLIEAPLQERAVDIDDRLHAGLRHAGGKRHGVTFADAGIEKRSGISSRILPSLFPSHMAAVSTQTLLSRCIAL